MSNRVRAGLALLAGGVCAALVLLPRLASAPDAPAVRFEAYPEIAPRGYLCYRAADPPTIDGKLDDPAWALAPWSEDFCDIEGDKKPAPAQRTRMKMLWDDRHLYVAAQLDETHVWGTLTRHDSVIFHDNDFEVFLDPDADSHLYAELELNALNTTWDLLLPRPYKDGGKAVDAWEVRGLRTAVHVDGTLNDPRDTDRGWSVEIAWPWRPLAEISTCPVPPRDGDRWRINFSRVEWRHEIVDGHYRTAEGRREDNWVWSPQGVIDMHRPERWGVVQFSTARRGKGTARPDPSQRPRHLLHRLYYAQRDYHKARGRWAARLAELPAGFDGVRLETTSAGYEASVPVGGAEGGKPRRWHIRSDGHIWAE